MSRIDKTIDTDLAALGENSRRELPPLHEVLRTPLAGDAYRDDRPGAEARRNALADERRRELVLMPLTLSHVFARRVGRIAAGAMALVVSTKMVAMLADPLLMQFAAWMIPGLSLGMLILIAALLIVAAYVVATWFAEAWFARRMREAIKTRGDAYEDLDHLARGPLEIAHAAVQKVDAWAFTVFLAGATTVTLVFGYVIVMVGAQHTLDRPWQITEWMQLAMRNNLGILAFASMASVAAAWLAGRGGDDSQLRRLLSGWPALAVAGVVGLMTAYFGLHTLVTWRHVWPEDESRVLLALGSAIVVFVPTAWALLFWRRREQARINV